jgi:CheY-like chemotaxis protein
VATILVADDDPRNRLLLATVLEAYGHVVIEAASGIAALALAREHRPDLAIVDLNMPDIDGIGVIRRLRDDPATATVKVLINSATADPLGADAVGKMLVVDGVLPKPSDPLEIVRIVSAALSGERIDGTQERDRSTDEERQI